MRIVIVAMACWMLLATGVAVSKEPVFIKAPPPWAARDALQVPALPADVPSSAAGCLVVGHHILIDGTTAKARIMQGAYTGNVAAQDRAGLEAATLAIADRWRFQYTGRKSKPSASFNMIVVGFGPASVPGAPRAVIGIEAQDARVQSSCKLDLVEWGERNAIPVEEARARDDQDMLFNRPDDPASYWTGKITPGRYPVDAARYGAQGCVVVGFRIGVDGVPSEYRILSSYLVNAKSDRFRRQFEQSALTAAAAWRYSPGPDNLWRRPEFMQVPMDFRLGMGKATFTCESVDLVGAAAEATH